MYLYALVHHSAIEIIKALLPMGIATEVILCEAGALGAIVEPGFPVEACAVSEQALIEAIVIHDRVLLAAFSATTVLPLRFGTEFRSETALLDHLHHNQATYLATLQALHGKAEVSLKLFPPQPDLAPISKDLKGREYFLAKKEQSQQQQLLQHSLDFDRHQLQQYLQNHNIQIFNKSVDHYLLLCDRKMDLNPILTGWQNQNQKINRSHEWNWELSEMLPPYHFANEILSSIQPQDD